jgi:hypothetical protein
LLEYDSKLIRVGKALLECAGILVIYSVFSYYRRIQLLSGGESYGYIDHFAPVFLSCAIFAGLIAIIVIFSVTIQEETDKNALFVIQPGELCLQHETAGVSLLEYQPSDVVVLENDSLFLVPSLETIGAHRISGPVETLATIPGADLEGLTVAGNRIYALGEVDKIGGGSEIIELAWNPTGTLDVIGRWKITTPRAEGIAFVPGSPNKLYVAGDSSLEVGNHADRGVIDVYELPDEGTASPISGVRLNSKLINDGLSDSKIAALQYFEGVLFVLHDNVQLVRAWDLNGELLSQWNLPPLAKQWEGMALERFNGQLRGGSGPLHLHLALDSPPQVWTLVVTEGSQRGEIRLPGCALPS